MALGHVDLGVRLNLAGGRRCWIPYGDLAWTLRIAQGTADSQTGTAPSNVNEAPAAQVHSEVDSFMKRVFENRDTSWRRLGDFVLREIHTLYLEAPTEIPVSSFRRDYEWYVRDGAAVRRPVRFTGALIDEERQQNDEEEWLHEESQRRAGRDGEDPEVILRLAGVRLGDDIGPGTLETIAARLGSERSARCGARPPTRRPPAHRNGSELLTGSLD